jgi:hypothetical protein
MGFVALGLSGDAGWLHFHAVPQQPWPRLCAKRDEAPPGNNGRMRDSRQVVGETLHPQTMQIDTDELRGEIPASGDGHLGPRSAD